MSVIGLFGQDVFGSGYFGVISQNIPITATVINSLIESALVQEFENIQQIGNTVTIGGVDVSDLVESITIRTSERRVVASCTLVLIGSSPATVAVDAEVEVITTFRFETGDIFTNTLFTGVIRSIQPSSGSKTSSVTVLSYDAADAALSAAPTNATWTGTNVALVASELTAAGFATQDLDFASFSMTAVDVSGFATVRDLILAAANALDEAVAWIKIDGTFCVKSVTAFSESGFTVPQTGYTYLQQTNNANDRYSTVTVQGITGLTGSSAGTGYYSLSETSSFLTLAADCETKAAAIVARSEAIQWSAQVPLNPLVRVGDIITVVDENGVDQSCRVTGVSHTVQWSSPESSPGAWSNIQLEDAA